MIEHNGKYYLNLPSGTIIAMDLYNNPRVINIYVDDVLLQYKISFIHINNYQVSDNKDINIILYNINKFNIYKNTNYYIQDGYYKFTPKSVGFYYSIVVDNEIDLAKIKMLCNDTNL